MAWVFEEESETVSTEKPSDGWVMEDGRDKEPETNYLRAFGGAAKDFLIGGFNMASQMLGGGEDSRMAQGEKINTLLDQVKYNQQFGQMSEEGISQEEIISKLGNKPREPLSITETVDEMTGGSLIPQTPTERVIQEGGKTAGEFLTMNALLPGSSTLTSLAKEAGMGGLFGVGAQLAKEDDQSQAGQIAQGTLFMLTPYLLAKGKGGLSKAIDWGKRFTGAGELPSGMPRFLEEAGTKGALADLELSSKDLVGRTAKLSEESVSKFEELVGKVAEPSFENLGTFRAADIEEGIVKSNQRSLLDKISPAAKTQKESWEGIQKYVEGNFEALKETYSKLYDVVEQQAKNIRVVPTATQEAASKIYNDLAESIVKAPEEGGVKKALEDIVNTLKPMAEGGVVEIPLSQLLAGKRSINRLLSKSDIIPAPIDLLKPVSRAMKLDTLAALENTGLKNIYQSAETQFANAQEVFNNDAIKKLRKTDSPEAMTSFFKSPSNIERLKTAIGDNKMVNDFTDRIIVENITSKNNRLAKELANESRQYLSKNANEIMDKVLDYGDKLTSPGQQSLARGRVLEDLQKAFDTGARPSATLDMMQSKVGYDIVKDTLSRSPKGKRMFKSLQRMTLEDAMASIIGDNKKIDFERAKDIFKNPQLKSVIEDSLGKEGANFFQNLETYGKNMSDNLSRLKLKEPSLFNKMIDKYLGSKLKYVLFALSPAKAAVGILAGEGSKQVQRAMLFRAIENDGTRGILKQLGQKNITPQTTENLIKRFGQVGSKIDGVKEE